MATKVEPSKVEVTHDTISGICLGCGKTFQFARVLLDGKPLLQQHWCDPCISKKNVESAQLAFAGHERELVLQWEKVCPADYRSTKLDRLTEEMTKRKVVGKLNGETIPVKKLIEMVLEWDASKGLGLVGPTGHGKTRLMWLLLRQLHFSGSRIVSINGASFADGVAASYEKNEQGRGSAEQFLQKYISAQMLLIDDVDKFKVTERSETAIYRLLEERRAAGRKLFFTSNSSVSNIAARMSEQRGDPILTRFADLATIIHL